ncbi:MAG: type II toxin-antitoxin system VapC family toxin [Chloroflexota bacterium]
MFFAAPRAAVVDASATIDSLLGIERWQERMERLIRERVALFAPTGFPLEVANGLLVGQRRSPAEVRSHLRKVEGLEIELSDLSSRQIAECISLAARHQLTLYDAAYLHLAIELEAELVTGDRALARAARAEGLVVHD